MRHNKDGQHPLDPEGWVDVGCPDPARAAANRELVAEKRFIQAYLEIEAAIRHTPMKQHLPAWMIGVIAEAGGGA